MLPCQLIYLNFTLKILESQNSVENQAKNHKIPFAMAEATSSSVVPLGYTLQLGVGLRAKASV